MKQQLLKGSAFLAAGIALSQVTLHSPTPEQNENLWNALPAFAVFLLFAYALLSLGAFIRKKIKLPPFNGAENGVFDLSAGTTALYILGYVLTPIDLFSSHHRIFLWFILSVAVALGSGEIKPSLWFSFAKSKWSKFLLAVPLLIVVLKLIEGVQFPLHGDAYVAYLPGPRSWGANGNFTDFLKFPQLFVATTWETLYAWGTALMGLRGGAGLDLTQFFAQWCTGGIAVLGIVLGVIAISSRLALVFVVNAEWFPVIAVSAVQIPVLRWTSNLAKNDTGVAFLGLAAFYIAAYLAPLSPVLAMIAGAVTGAAVMGKLTISLLGICIGFGVLIAKPKHFIAFVFGGLIGIAPVIARNMILTHNPVFPWYESLFPSGLLSPTILKGVGVATKTSLTGSAFLFYLKEIQNELPLWLGMLVLLFVSRERKSLLKAAWVPLIAILLFTCTFRSSTEIRYQNASLVIMAVFLCYYCFYLFTKLPAKVGQGVSALFALALIGTANITTFTLFQIGSSKFAPLKDKLGNLTGGEGKLWVRQHLKSEDKILLVGDPHLYYLIDYQITELVESIEWDIKMNTQDIQTFEHTLQNSSFDYIYLANDLSFFTKLTETAQMMKDSVLWNQKCKRYETSKVQIWDVKCLKQKTSPG